MGLQVMGPEVVFGMNTSAATAAANQLGATVDQTTAAAVRNYAKLERSVEALVGKIERQTAVFGLSKSEILAASVEMQGYAASTAGLTEAAGRLAAAHGELVAKERAASIAAAEQAAAVRDAAIAHQQFEARVRAGAQALRDEAAAAKALEQSISLRDAAIAHGQFEAAVRQGAAAMKTEEEQARRTALALEAIQADRAAEEHTRLASAVQASRAAQVADAEAAERLRAATDPLYAATSRLNAEIAESTRLYRAGATGLAEYERQQEVLTGRLAALGLQHGALAGAAGKSSFAMKNFAIQIPDIAQGLLTGQHPMTVFIQQGGQIAQVAMMAEGGIKGFVGELAMLALRFAPLIGVAAAVYAGLKLVTSSLEDDAGLKKYSEGLGLTHDEMKKLKDVSVTTGDVMVGIWRTLNADSALGSFITKAKAWFADLRDTIVSAMRTGAAVMYGAWVGAYRATIDTWRQWPSALGDLMVQAVNKAIDGINWLARGVNTLLGKDVLGQIGHLENAYAGAGRQLGNAYTKAFQDAYKEGDEALASAGRNIIQASKDRIKAQADEISFDRRASEAARDHAKALREEAAELKRQAELRRELATVLFEEAAAFSKHIESMGKIDLTDSLKKNVEMLARWVEGSGTLAKMNEEMARQATLLDAATASAGKLADAFGRVGAGIGAAVTVLAEFSKQQALLDQRRAAAGHDQDKIDKINRDAARLQVGAYADMAGAAQDFFKKGSTGYKVLGDAEKAFRLAQFALSVEAVAVDMAETGKKLATGAARTAAGAVEAVVNAIKSLPFPLNIAAGAATIGALAGIGVGVVGSFGGSHNNLPASNTGTGTVFGDSSAKSDSIQRAIETLNDTDVLTAGYSAQMAASLKSIENQIGGLSSLVVRTGNINASAGVDMGVHSTAVSGIVKATVPVIGALLGGVIDKLFGSKTTVIGSGITANDQSVGSILSTGFDASYYSDIEKQKKLFGITTSTKFSTQTTGADAQIEQQFGMILKGFYQTIAAAAPALGDATGAIEDRLSNFVVSIGKIDLQGLSGTEIQDKLTAVFGAAADQMAQAGFPGLEKFQQVGEGYFETLARVASTVETVTSSLQQLGLATQSLGIDASMGIAGKFDSISDYQSAVESYFQSFYTDAEQAAAKTAQLSQAFNALGISMPDSIASFRHLVEAQNLSTDAGQSTYAMLLKLAPAFAEVVNTGNGATSAATSAADIARERADLEQRLLELGGDTVAIRAAELAKIDPANRAIQERIYALQDEQAATEAAAQAAQAAAATEKAIADERAGLERQILELNGDTAAIRALDLAKIDASNQALQLNVWALQDQAAAISASTAAAKAAADEQASLDQQLLQAQGNTAAIRAATLAGLLSGGARATQQMIWDIQDQAAAAAEAQKQQEAAQQAAEQAAQAAQQLADAWSSIADTILAEVQRIRGLTSTGAQSYAALLSQFNASTDLARSGDQDAAKSLPELSKGLLDAAALVATSRQELARVQGVTAASLEQTYALITAITGASAPSGALPTSAASSDDGSAAWWAASAAKVGASATVDSDAEEMRGLRADLQETKDELVNALGQIAAFGRRAAVVLERVETQGEGEGFAVKAAA